MDEHEIDEYVEQSRQLIESSPGMDEQNTKAKLIQPFLDLLGWDFYSTEVELEYMVQMGSRNKHVDYALFAGDSPAVFVEAKSLRDGLDNDDLGQLRSYMRQKLDVDWGILTDGRSFEVLTKQHDRENGEEISVAQFDLERLAETPEVLELLTKESIRTGRADEIAEDIDRTNRAIRKLREAEGTVAASVAEAIEDEISAVGLDVQEHAREFVQDLVDVLREHRQFVTGEASSGTAKDRGRERTDSEVAVNRVAGTIDRQNIEGEPDAQVAVFPTRESGLPFLKENEAWGFVKIGREFDYVAMYVTGDAREVRYVAEVRDVVEPNEADLEREPEAYVDRAEIADQKKVVDFEPGSLHELENPIPFESKYPQSLRYTTLAALREAADTDDLF